MVSTLKYGGIGFVALVLDLVPGANSAMSLVRPPLVRSATHPIGFVALVLDLVPGANSAMSLVRPPLTCRATHPIGLVALVLALVPGANSAMSLVRPPLVRSATHPMQPRRSRTGFSPPASHSQGWRLSYACEAACLRER